MRILQTLYDGGGGVPPQLAITRRLIERGHDVRVLGHDTLRSRVEQRGAQLTVFATTLPGHDMTREDTDTVRDWDRSDPFAAAERFRDMVLFGPALANAHEVLGVLDTWPADVIVFDWLLFGTALAAQVAAVPAVALVHAPYPLRIGEGPLDAFFAPGLDTMNTTRGAFGLEPLAHWDEQLLTAQSVLVMTAPELDPATAYELPGNVHHVGPAFEPSHATWTSPWPTSNIDPLVLISFSTTFMDQRDIADRVIQAVAGLPVRALVTTGPALNVDGLPVPPNVHITPFAPHDIVMPHTALVITHAGFGTVQAALACGVPMVCIPCGRDQPGNAAHLVQLGAALVANPTATTTELRTVITAALADPQLTTNAQRLGLALRSDGVAAAINHIEHRATSATGVT